jgi:multidrug transporter EmrE-like cation transporter
MTMQPGTLALVLGTVMFSVAGQLLLKAGARLVVAERGAGFLVAALANARVLLGLGAWAMSTICWLFVLRAAPLSRAYGLTSLTYVLVLLASVHLFGESLRPVHIAGTILIVIGIACLLQGE